MAEYVVCDVCSKAICKCTPAPRPTLSCQHCGTMDVPVGHTCIEAALDNQATAILGSRVSIGHAIGELLARAIVDGYGDRAITFTGRHLGEDGDTLRFVNALPPGWHSVPDLNLDAPHYLPSGTPIPIPRMRYGRSDADYICAHAVWFDFGIIRLTYRNRVRLDPDASLWPLVGDCRLGQRCWDVTFRDGSHWETPCAEQQWTMAVTWEGRSIFNEPAEPQ